MGETFEILVATGHGLVQDGTGEGGAADLLAGRDVTDVVPDGEGWLVLVDGTEVLTGEPAGGWKPVAAAPAGGLTCLLPTRSGLLAGGEKAVLSRADGGLEAVGGFDRVAGREDWHTPWGGPPAVRSLAEGPDGALYVNVHVGGIARSLDGGETWAPTIDIHTDVHQVVVDQASGRLLAACGVGGLALSDDRGDSWWHLTEGLHGQYCRAVAVSDGTVLVSASTGPSTRQGALYRLEGDRFLLCDAGLPERVAGNIDTRWLAAAGRNVALVLPDGGLHVSDDAGHTWRPAAAAAPSPRAVGARSI